MDDEARALYDTLANRAAQALGVASANALAIHALFLALLESGALDREAAGDLIDDALLQSERAAHQADPFLRLVKAYERRTLEVLRSNTASPPTPPEPKGPVEPR